MDETRDTSSTNTESLDNNEGFTFTFYDPSQATINPSVESSVLKNSCKLYGVRDVVKLDKSARPVSRPRVISVPSPNIKPKLSSRSNDNKFSVPWSQKSFEALKYLKIEAKDFRIKPTKIERKSDSKLPLKKSVSLECDKFSGPPFRQEALEDFLKPLPQDKHLPPIYKPVRTNSARRMENSISSISSRATSTIRKRNVSERSRNLLDSRTNELSLKKYRKHLRESMVSNL